VPSAAADGDRWAPVVVDEPIFDFEPKPPASRFYRPDTVFDAWSTDDFTVRMASVRGYSHRYSGLPRQDAAEVAFHPRTRAVVFAVADGVSSARESHIGAEKACEAAVSVLRWQLSSGHGRTNFAEVVDVSANRIVREAAHILRQERPDRAAVEDLFATTLVAGYLLPDEGGGAAGSMIQIGDSSAWVLHNGRYHSLLDQKHDPQAEVISSAVSPLPRVPTYMAPLDFRLQRDEVLLIGTDGFGDPLGDGDGKVGQLFTGHLTTPPSGRALAHLLDFSRETFDDDRTLVAVWQRPPEIGERL
jgi:serine/threonine protein phosphatase PrpC